MTRIYNIRDELKLSDGCLCLLTFNTKVLEFSSTIAYATRYMTKSLNPGFASQVNRKTRMLVSNRKFESLYELGFYRKGRLNMKPQI